MATSSGVAKAAFGAAVAGAAIAAFAPGLFQAQGAWVLVVVSVPVAVALIPLLVRRRPARIAAAVLLWLCCVAGLLSVGIFFLPAAILMTIAAAKHDDPVVTSSVG